MFLSMDFRGFLIMLKRLTKETSNVLKLWEVVLQFKAEWRIRGNISPIVTEQKLPKTRRQSKK
ncbi:hypothetical protein D3C72_1372090 [compost metagenome]